MFDVRVVDYEIVDWKSTIGQPAPVETDSPEEAKRGGAEAAERSAEADWVGKI